MTVTDTVFKMVKDNLHITYTLDESSESRIKNEILSGMACISKYTQNPKFEPGGDHAAMLCEYVLRAESGALESFEKDYENEIIQMSILSEIDTYTKDGDSGD